jgi:hypothetical protein
MSQSSESMTFCICAGPLLVDVSHDHLLSLTAAITMTGIAIIGVTVRARQKRFRLS